MAVNQNHSEDRRRAIIPQGESLLKQCSDVELSFPQPPQGSSFFSGTKRGMLFLTSYRVIFVTSPSVKDPMLSFMMPFNLMTNCAVEQPVFGANYIKGTIKAAPDGGWEGQATFKLVFRKGGAIDFAQLMTRAAAAAAQGFPLGVANFWIGPQGILVAGQRSMCPPQTPCQVVVYEVLPVGGYGAQAAGYRAPPPGYVIPPSMHGTPPPGYVVPPPAHGAPPPAYVVPPPPHGVLPPAHGVPPPPHGAPPPAYVAPPLAHRAPPPPYIVPPPAYVAPPPTHGAPPPAYAASPLAYGAPSGGHGAPPPSYTATPGGGMSPPPGYEGSPVGLGSHPSGYRSVPPGYTDSPAGSGVGPTGFETPGIEGSLPSTSSMQPHPPHS